MFQFQGGISDGDKERMFSELQKRGHIVVAENGRVQYPRVIRGDRDSRKAWLAANSLVVGFYSPTSAKALFITSSDSTFRPDATVPELDAPKRRVHAAWQLVLDPASHEQES